MKLLESAKDLKTSCYIYFLIGTESSTYITNIVYYHLLNIGQNTFFKPKTMEMKLLESAKD